VEKSNSKSELEARTLPTGNILFYKVNKICGSIPSFPATENQHDLNFFKALKINSNEVNQRINCQ
jgi:hypothetical protein